MKRAHLLILLTAVIFSTMEIFGRIVGRDLNPTQINFWRFLIASAVLLPVALRSMRRRHLRLTPADLCYFLVSGAIGVALSMGLFQSALAFTPASTVAIVISCMPVAIIPFACLFLGESFTPATAVSLGLSIVGVACILDPLSMNPDFRGVLLAVGAALSFAAYSVMGKGRTRRYGAIPFTCFSFLGGTVVILAMIGASYVVPAAAILPAWLAPFRDIPLLAGFNWRNLLAMLYFSVIGTGVSYIFFFQAMEETSASTGSVVFFIKPALAPVLAFLFLGERLAGNVLVGIAFILAGTFFVFRASRRTEDGARLLQAARPFGAERH